MASRIRKLPRWRRFFDKGLRNAIERSKNTTEYQTVDYTDSGVAITMPADIAHQWDAMPAEVRAEFMASVEAQIKTGGDATGHHDWIG